MADGADLILRNGEIITFDPQQPRASALAIAGGRIAAVGAGAEDLRGSATRVVDLQGRCVIPGINDTHAHMEREGLKEQRPSLAGAASVDEILRRIRDAAARTPRGSWIVTMPIGAPPYYFDALSTLAERRMPTKGELDAAAPGHAVYIPGLF